MLLTFKVKNGKTLQFEASDLIHRSFSYPTEYGLSDYYDICFFLTTHKDIIMTAGRTTNDKQYINDPGTYDVPFALVINNQILSSISTSTVLGIKFRTDTKGFIKNLTKLLDKKLETHFMIQPFSAELEKNELENIKTLLILLTNIQSSNIIQEQLTTTIQYIDDLKHNQDIK